MTHRRLVPLLVILLLAATSCAGGGTVEGSAKAEREAEVAPAELDWKRCRGRARDLDESGRLRCAAIEVPLDYGDEAGGTIRIAVARVPASGDDPIGSLIMNPGGPGASGIEALAALVTQMPDELTSRFHLVSFDPRGVGESEGIECLDDAEQDALFFDPEPGPVGDEAVEETRRIADACSERSGRLLPHVGTVNAARDLDRLRAVLGDDRLTYLGYSYGTLLGAVYAEMFPDRVRALVLDGPVDPGRSSSELTGEQTEGFQTAFDRWAAECAAQPACPIGPDPKAAVATLRDRLVDGPIEAPRAPGGGRLTLNNAGIALVQTFYAQELWAAAAQGVADALEGDGSVLLTMAASYVGRSSDGTWRTILASNRAIGCADDPARPDPATVDPPEQDPIADWPFGATEAEEDELSCLYWVPSRSALPRVDVSGLPPVLIVATTGDPATPESWADGLRDALEGSVVLRLEGEGHTAFPGDDCVDEAVITYLLEVEVPEDGATCTPESIDGDVDDGGGPYFGDLGRELGRVLEDVLATMSGTEPPEGFVDCFDQRMDTIGESDLALLIVAQDPADLDRRTLSRVQRASVACITGG